MSADCQESRGQVPDGEGHNRDLFTKGLVLEGLQTHYHGPFPRLQRPPTCVRYVGQRKCVTSQGHIHVEPTGGGLPAACPLVGAWEPQSCPLQAGRGCKSLQLSVPDYLLIKVRSTDYLGGQPCICVAFYTLKKSTCRYTHICSRN